MKRKISRQDLYKAVWERPMRDIASCFNVSRATLRKICRQHAIPVPGRGYWTQIQAGYQRERPPLDNPGPGIPDVIYIGMPIGRRHAVRIESNTPRPSANVFNRNPKNRSSLNPVAARLARELSRRRANENNLLNIRGQSLVRVCVSEALAARTVQFVDVLFRTAKANGLAIAATASGLGFVYKNYDVSIQITESVKRIPHRLTLAEIDRIERWEARCDKCHRHGRAVPIWDKPYVASWDYVPSERLEVQIDDGTHYDGLRRRFADGKVQRIEALIPRILEGVALCGLAAEGRRKQRTQHNVQRHQANRDEVERSRLESSKRGRQRILERVSADWLQAYRIDRFVEAITREGAPEQMPESTAQFLDWCKQRAKQLRARSSVHRIADALEGQHLTDDLEIGNEPGDNNVH